MNALVFVGTRRMELRTVADPEPGPSEVCLRVAEVGVCGSEMHSFLGHSTYRRAGTVFGHEVIGEVVAGGPGVPPGLLHQRFVVDPIVACGTCRPCREGRTNVCASRRLLGAEVPGGFADFVVAPSDNLLAVGSDVPDEVAVLAEPMANGVHVSRLLPNLVGRRIAVIGCGPIGLCCLMVILLGSGGASIVAIDPVEQRRHLAGLLGDELGRGARLQTLLEPEDLEPFNFVIDAVGTDETRQRAIAIAGPGATVVELGLHAPSSVLPMNDAIRKELHLACSFAYVREDFQTAIDIITQFHRTLAPWTTVQPLAVGEDAMNRLADRPDQYVKLVLQP